MIKAKTIFIFFLANLENLISFFYTDIWLTIHWINDIPLWMTFTWKISGTCLIKLSDVKNYAYQLYIYIYIYIYIEREREREHKKNIKLNLLYPFNLI